MEVLIGWFVFGIVGSLVAIFVFRRDGTTTRHGELYMAVIGPLFGPVVAILIFIDFVRKGRK